MADLDGSSTPVDLGRQFVLIAPGLAGRAELREPGTSDLRAAEQATPALDAALARVEMTTFGTVEINATPVPGRTAGPTAPLRDAHGDDALALEVPDLGANVGQVVMSVDEAGAVSWHFSEPTEARPGASRGAGGKRRFIIRKYSPPIPGPGETANRSLIGAIGKKLLKVLVYPITDVLIGKPAAVISEHWETAHRQYGLRDFTPDNYNSPNARSLDSADIELLSQGKALLMIHGTFSTTHGGFADMPHQLVEELHHRYAGRIFAFNHFTLSHDPLRNVKWFTSKLAELSPGTKLNVDIVCHSRGGLVARTLREGAALFGLNTDQVQTDRIIFVAVPNRGTLLAEPDHMVQMIDRLTTGLNLIPPGGFADILDGILIAVKIIGHGALKGLDGLQSMNVKETFMKTLNSRGAPVTSYFAVAANYEPNDPGLKAIVSGTVDAVLDRVFENAENDLVVPEHGVYEANGNSGFPIDAARSLRLPASAGRMHTKLFGDPQVADRINEWLR